MSLVSICTYIIFSFQCWINFTEFGYVATPTLVDLASQMERSVGVQHSMLEGMQFVYDSTRLRQSLWVSNFMGSHCLHSLELLRAISKLVKI